MAKLNILVIGTGMYVCGRGTDGYGTIMPAICEWAKTHQIGKIYVAGRTKKGVVAASAKVRDLQETMGVELDIEFLPRTADDPASYIKALNAVPAPDCAIIAVPDYLHKKTATAAIGKGLDVLVVKPLVAKTKDAFDLIRLQERRGVYCAVEFHKRLDSANMKLKDILESGSIGDPLYFLVEFSQRKSMPTKIFKNWVGKTNIFQYLGVHYVDIIYYATKALPIRVSATGQRNWLVSKGINAYDSIEAVIEWRMSNGKKFVSHILTNWIDPESTTAMSDQKIKVVGTKGRFESDQKKRGIFLVTDEKGNEEPNPYFCSPYGKKGEVSYRGYGIDSIHQFLNDVSRIEEGTVTVDELEKDRATFRDSLVSTKALEAINRSLKKGGEWMEIG